MPFVPQVEIPIWRPGKPGASEIILKKTFRTPVTLNAADWCVAVAGVVFAAERLFVFSKSTDSGVTWEPFASITFPSGGDAPFLGTVARAGDWSTFAFDAGHAMKFEAPGTQDDTGADIDVAVLATRVGA